MKKRPTSAYDEAGCAKGTVRQDSVCQNGQQAQGPDGEWIELSVTDTGIGILPEHQQRIFKSPAVARVSTHLELLVVHRQQAKKVRTLEGILPICCQCKKIRDDQGNWSEVELYVGARSQAEFSHGLCPTCGEAALRALDRKS